MSWIKLELSCLPSDRALICNYSNNFQWEKIQTSKYNHLPYIYTNDKHVIMNHQKLNLCNLIYSLCSPENTHFSITS